MTALLAPDPAVPQRDALLDERRMAALLGSRLTGAAAEGCERLNAKYRVGDSLRVAYRITVGGERHTVAGRTFSGRSASVYSRAAAAVGESRLPGVLHAPELETVFWTFPNDRRLAGLPLLDGRSAALDRLVGRPVAHTRLMAYAPERAATAECLDAGGRVIAYAKVHWDAAGRELANVEAAASAVGPADPHLRLPHVLAASLPDGALVLEPLAGRRLDGLPTAELGSALRALGAGLATLHGVRPLPPRRFDRLDADRLALAAGVIGRARPDCRATAAGLVARLLECASDGAGAPVHLHGDANLRNALLDGSRIALVDLEDAAAGPAGADLGFVLAGLCAARAQERLASGEQAALAAALLGGYAAVAPVPDATALRWHTAASALARVAVPAVGRVRPVALAHLEPMLRAAEELVA
jgi:aminoglycoside phosphotransferase (APT) family kinase protein